MNVDKLITDSLDDPAQIAETVIKAIVDPNKRVLSSQLRRLKKIKGSWTQSILTGYPFAVKNSRLNSTSWPMIVLGPGMIMKDSQSVMSLAWVGDVFGMYDNEYV